jgi:hypothetical protein
MQCAETWHYLEQLKDLAAACVGPGNGRAVELVDHDVPKKKRSSRLR